MGKDKMTKYRRASVMVRFDASTSSLPASPPNMRLDRIGFETCPGSDLSLRLVSDVGKEVEVDDRGMAADSWWRVSCSGLPDRTLRLMRGSHSLSQLLLRYGFQDATGCVNHKHVVAAYSPLTARSDPLLDVPLHLREATGVPQFEINSGVCWYNTMCWLSAANAPTLSLLTSRLPAETGRHLAASIFSREEALSLRRRLWYDYTVGDDVEAPPEEDGRNGFTEFSVLCARVGVPLLRLRESGGSFKEMDPRVTDMRSKTHRLPPVDRALPHLLGIRFQDGDHDRFPVLRRFRHAGRRYRLVGCYVGGRKCGHQIGVASPSCNWREWTISDADLSKDGIGPTFVRFEGEEWRERWWRAWKELIHVTKFGLGRRDFCSLSLHNPPSDSLDRYRGGERPTSLDCLFVSE